jgi:outer membrane protein assembly factor BamA
MSPAYGGLSFTGLLVDYRRYLMPVRPYTVATRLQYQARYGANAGDARLQPLFVGARNLVRGYDLSSLSGSCTSTVQGECEPIDRLIGPRTLVANIEVRFPLLGVRSRTQTYGTVPIEGVLFADGGLAGGGSPALGPARQRMARSLGVAVRIAPFGFVAEIGAVRTFDHPTHGWSLLLDFQPGF